MTERWVLNLEDYEMLWDDSDVEDLDCVPINKTDIDKYNLYNRKIV